jgi:hypothetical protein
MLEQENAFYKAHQAEFREKYLNKWLVITGASLFGVYDTTTGAVEATLGKFEPGKIMIHRPSDDGKVIPIGPRIRTKHPETSGKTKLRPEMSYSGGGLLQVPYPY